MVVSPYILCYTTVIMVDGQDDSDSTFEKILNLFARILWPPEFTLFHLQSLDEGRFVCPTSKGGVT